MTSELVETPEVVEPSEIVTRRERADNLTALAITKRDELARNFLELGEIITVVSNEGLHTELGDASFQDWLERRVGIKMQAGRYYMKMAALPERLEGITKEDLVALGPGKARFAASLADADAEAASKFVKDAQEMSYREAVDRAQEVRREALGPKTPSEIRKAARIRLSYSLGPEDYNILSRAMELAAEITGTNNKEECLLIILSEFISTYNEPDSKEKAWENIDMATRTLAPFDSGIRREIIDRIKESLDKIDD